MIIQFCGLSGSGKSTLAYGVKALLGVNGIKAEVIDGDVYRKLVSADLGFSKADRNKNIRRLAAVANGMANDGIVAIISAINPYDDIRQEIAGKYADVKTVYIDCDLQTLKLRDTKQLYHKAFLPDEHPDKIHNLSGVNDPFEVPQQPDLVIKTGEEDIETSTQKLFYFITSARVKKIAMGFKPIAIK
jgi:adenylylsulfate kinase